MNCFLEVMALYVIYMTKEFIFTIAFAQFLICLQLAMIICDYLKFFLKNNLITNPIS